MDKAVKNYHKSYDTHLQNLQKLDDYANFNGMENLFKKVLMKDNFRDGKVDKSVPILFRNYLIEEETTPTAFRKEHILRQVNYVLGKYFSGREHMFIKHLNVEVGKNEFELTVQTIVVDEVNVIPTVAVSPALLVTLNALVLFDEFTIKSPGCANVITCASPIVTLAI
jgi:hypothetical protein